MKKISGVLSKIESNFDKLVEKYPLPYFILESLVMIAGISMIYNSGETYRDANSVGTNINLLQVGCGAGIVYITYYTLIDAWKNLRKRLK